MLAKKWQLKKLTFEIYILDKIFKNGPSKIF